MKSSLHAAYITELIYFPLKMTFIVSYLNKYVCLFYLSIYTYIHTYIYVYIYIYICVCVRVCVCVCVCVCVYNFNFD